MFKLDQLLWSRQCTQCIACNTSNKMQHIQSKWREDKKKVARGTKRNIQLTSQTNSGDKLFYFGWCSSFFYWIVSLYRQFVSFVDNMSEIWQKWKSHNQKQIAHWTLHRSVPLTVICHSPVGISSPLRMAPMAHSYTIFTTPEQKRNRSLGYHILSK